MENNDLNLAKRIATATMKLNDMDVPVLPENNDLSLAKRIATVLRPY